LPSSSPITLTNTLGHQLEVFEPLEEGRVRLYSCGPTVYSYAHVGNFRAYLFADTLRRMLEFNGFEVEHARNITDVGHLTDETLNEGLDRIEKAAREQNITPWDVAQYYTDAFLRDAERVNLLPPTFSPRATDYIEPMIALIERLIQSGHAYVSGGDVYYAVDSFPTYGRLSGNSVSDLIAGARVEVGEGKRFAADFALWKAAGEDKLMRWPSPWGEGVPGWHIECSAMSMHLLGDQIDIHTGGVDNIFPHHEDERAQSEAATGKPFVRYWMHNAHLQLVEEKMSKSLGNIFTISDLVEAGFHPLTYRYFTFQAHYRTPLTFSFAALGAAQTALYRLWEAVAELLQTATPSEIDAAGKPFQVRFHEAVNRDLDLPSAVAVLHDLMGSKVPPGQKLALVEEFDRVLGLRLTDVASSLLHIGEDEREALERRSQARQERDFARSDEIRAALAAGGLDVRDSGGGQRWVRRDVLPVREQDAQ
jgi:cysteinyl-tRNA synthetase